MNLAIFGKVVITMRRWNKTFLNVCLINLLGMLFVVIALSACGINKRLKKVEVYPDWNDLRTISVVDNYMYATSYYDGFLIFDISDPLKPQMLGTVDALEQGHRLTISDHHAYLVNGGLHIIDISTLTNPVEIGKYRLSTPALEVAVQPPYAYLAAGDGDLHIIDISDLTRPEKVEVYRPGESVREIEVKDDYAYAVVSTARGESIVEVIDISDPSEPRRASTITAGLARDVTVKEDYVYVTNGRGLQIWNISNPFGPIQVSSFDTPNVAEFVKIEGNYAYIGDLFGIEVIDITDIREPSKVGSYKLEQVRDLVVIDGYILVADDFLGLVILEAP